MAETVPNQLSCPGSDGTQFTAGSAVFNVHCGIDYYGGDLARVDAATFEDCLTSCASTTGCIDVAYAGQNCYMKNVFTSSRQNDNVWGAVLASAEEAAGNKLSCVNGKSDGAVYTAVSGDQFLIQCGVDYFGGDFASLYAETFEDCLEACDTSAGCLDVAYNGKYCYLKNTITDAANNAAVWGAKKVGEASTTPECQNRPATGLDNGYTIYADTFWYGPTLLGTSFDVYNLQDCENYCNSFSGACYYFTYSPNFGYCEAVANDGTACHGGSSDFIGGARR